MRKFISTSLFALLTIAPAIAAASPSATGDAPASGITGILAAGTALVVSATALVRAIRGDRRATAAGEQAAAAMVSADRAAARAETAGRWADRLANAQCDGVVLVLSYPGARTCRGLLECNGWRIEHYQVTQAELDAGTLLPGPHLLADVAVADAIVVEGLDEADQDVTMPVTAEAAVRASLARREATARRQGVRPGGLAQARATLLA